MKSWLFLMCFLTSLATIGQQKKSVSQEKPEDSKLFLLGGKPVLKDCYTLNDFKQKIGIETPPSDVDSIQFRFFLVSGLKAVATKNIASLKDLQTLDVYSWLMAENVKGLDETRYESMDETGKTFVYKARPGDRLIVEMTFLWNGKKGAEYKKFSICN